MTDDTQHEAPEREVGCEDAEGLLHVHPESETCEVCAPPEQDGERGRVDDLEWALETLGWAVADMGSGEEPVVPYEDADRALEMVSDALRRSEVQGESEPRCPKCGSGDINAKWYDQCDAVYRRHHECDNTDEHLCRTCRNCGYGWDESVLDATRPQEPEGEDGA